MNDDNLIKKQKITTLNSSVAFKFTPLDSLQIKSASDQSNKNSRINKFDDYIIEGFATTCSIDYQNEFITEECIKDVLKKVEIEKVKVLYNHVPSHPIGKVLEMSFASYKKSNGDITKGLYVKIAILKNTVKGKIAITELKAGLVNSFSIGFLSLQQKRVAYDSETHGPTLTPLRSSSGNLFLTVHTSIELLEVSLVCLPANKNASILKREDREKVDIDYTAAIIKKNIINSGEYYSDASDNNDDRNSNKLYKAKIIKNLTQENEIDSCNSEEFEERDLDENKQSKSVEKKSHNNSNNFISSLNSNTPKHLIQVSSEENATKNNRPSMISIKDMGPKKIQTSVLCGYQVKEMIDLSPLNDVFHKFEEVPYDNQESIIDYIQKSNTSKPIITLITIQKKDEESAVTWGKLPSERDTNIEIKTRDIKFTSLSAKIAKDTMTTPNESDVSSQLTEIITKELKKSLEKKILTGSGENNEILGIIPHLKKENETQKNKFVFDSELKIDAIFEHFIKNVSNNNNSYAFMHGDAYLELISELGSRGTYNPLMQSLINREIHGIKIVLIDDPILKPFSKITDEEQRSLSEEEKGVYKNDEFYKILIGDPKSITLLRNGEVRQIKDYNIKDGTREEVTIRTAWVQIVYKNTANLAKSPIIMLKCKPSELSKSETEG